MFPHELLNFTAENIYQWAQDNRETLLRWLRPHGGKSLLLHNELRKGPALLLFLPFDPLAGTHPLINEVSQGTCSLVWGQHRAPHASEEPGGGDGPSGWIDGNLGPGLRGPVPRWGNGEVGDRECCSSWWLYKATPVCLGVLSTRPKPRTDSQGRLFPSGSSGYQWPLDRLSYFPPASCSLHRGERRKMDGEKGWVDRACAGRSAGQLRKRKSTRSQAPWERSLSTTGCGPPNQRAWFFFGGLEIWGLGHSQ